MVDLLRERGAGHIKVFGGGGGVIVPAEIARAAGLRRRAHLLPRGRPAPGPAGHDRPMWSRRADFDRRRRELPAILDGLGSARPARAGAADHRHRERHGRRGAAGGDRRAAPPGSRVPVLGITGTGGSGKSSLTDELIRRFRLDRADESSIAVLAVDPTRRQTGGALLGDRIRMNADRPAQRLHALAGHRDRPAARCPAHVPHVIAAVPGRRLRPGHRRDPGIGQGDAAVAELADLSLYVMTPEFGAASQLEKIDMLDFADFVAINKFDRQAAPRTRCATCASRCSATAEAFGDVAASRCRSIGTIASRFNDDGVTGALPRPAGRRWPPRASTGRRAACRGRRRGRSSTVTADRAAGARALSGRDRRDGARLPRHRRSSRRRWRARCSS